MSKLQMKQFMYKYVIREKSQRIRATTNEKYIIATSLFILLQLFAYVQIQHQYELWDNYKKNNIVDKCRIKFMFVDSDNTKSFLCQSNKTNEYLLLNETESPKLRDNGYTNRPVNILKNGKID
jgi:hypothetical protein